MIKISDIIKLKTISLKNHQELVDLMCEIYPPAYKHLWQNQDCSWYLNHCYNKNNLKSELSEAQTGYYFVLYNGKKSGILRVNFNKTLNKIPEKSATYVHRIYLSAKIQGKGIAKQLFEWVEQQAVKNNSKLMWLEAMDSQEQALKFYKKQGFEITGHYRLNFNLMLEHLRGMVIFSKTL